MKKYKSHLFRLGLLIIFLSIISCSIFNSEVKIISAPTATLKALPTLPLPTALPTSTVRPTSTLYPTKTPKPSPTTPLPTPTEHGVTNPQGILPAGMPVIMDGYVMVVDPSGLEIEGKYINFSIQVRVIGDQAKLFRFNASALRLKDDLGNEYDYYYNESFSNRCTESDIYLAKQLNIPAKEKVTIEPMSGAYYWWCLVNYDNYIPGFYGSIPPEASSLILEFEGFGPFSGFSYEFEL